MTELHSLSLRESPDMFIHIRYVFIPDLITVSISLVFTSRGASCAGPSIWSGCLLDMSQASLTRMETPLKGCCPNLVLSKCLRISGSAFKFERFAHVVYI